MTTAVVHSPVWRAVGEAAYADLDSRLSPCRTRALANSLRTWLLGSRAGNWPIPCSRLGTGGRAGAQTPLD